MKCEVKFYSGNGSIAATPNDNSHTRELSIMAASFASTTVRPPIPHDNFEDFRNYISCNDRTVFASLRPVSAEVCQAFDKVTRRAIPERHQFAHYHHFWTLGGRMLPQEKPGADFKEHASYS